MTTPGLHNPMEIGGADLTHHAFDITYILHSFDHNSRLRLKTRVGGEEPTVPSVVPLWPAAAWHEREVFDLFGRAVCRPSGPAAPLPARGLGGSSAATR